MTQVDIRQASHRFLELIELAAVGEDVICAKNDPSFVKLTPVEVQVRRRQYGSAKGLITLSEDFDGPLYDFEEYM